MKFLYQLSIVLLYLSVLTISLFSLGLPVKACIDVNTSQGITVLPAKFELASTAGASIKQSIKITNDDEHDYIYAISLDNIDSTGENGEVVIGSSNPNIPNLLSSWIKFDQTNGKIGAKETKIINYTINIPDGAERGGKYASVVISADRAIRNTNEPSATARVVSLVMLTIAGDFQDILKVSNFDLFKDNEELTFELKVRNNGINHTKPKGTIVITDIFGRKVDEVSLNGENVLPSATRRMSTIWSPPKNLFGVYTATLAADYGQQLDSSFTAVTRFYFFPIKYTIPMAILIIITTIFIFAAFKNYSRRKAKDTE